MLAAKKTNPPVVVLVPVAGFILVTVEELEEEAAGVVEARGLPRRWPQPKTFIHFRNKLPDISFIE